MITTVSLIGDACRGPCSIDWAFCFRFQEGFNSCSGTTYCSGNACTHLWTVSAVRVGVQIPIELEAAREFRLAAEVVEYQSCHRK